MSIAPQKAQSLADSLYILGKSNHNKWIHMHLLEFIVRKINNKTNFNQRDQYKN